MLRATCTIASILLLSVATHGADSLWEASSDLLPHEIEHPYTLVDDADPEEPALAGGVLTLATYRGRRERLQVRTSGAACFEAALGTVTKSDATLFKAKAP